MGFTAIIQAIKEFFGCGRALAEKAKQHEALTNSPKMQAAAEAQKDQAQIDQTNKAIATGDIEEERREFSE